MYTNPIPFALCLAALGMIPSIHAHFPILVHDNPLDRTNGPVTLLYAVGHPFELEMENAERPERIQCLEANGRSTNRTDQCRPTVFRGDTNGSAWSLQFTPARGDTVVALDSSAKVDDSLKTLYREFVKVIVHRGRQEGWNQRTGQLLELVPLTRPYGLRPGMVFTGRLMNGPKPLGDIEVYAEHLSDRRPDAHALPPEPLITFVTRTDQDGRFIISLPDAGWWVLGAYVDDLDSVRYEGKDYRQEGFAGLWLRVEP